MALKFGVSYMDLFEDQIKLTARKIFGAPFHAVINHLPELYEIIAPSQLNAEADERVFSDIR